MNHEFSVKKVARGVRNPVLSELGEFRAMLRFISKNKEGVKLNDARCVWGGIGTVVLIVISLLSVGSGDINTGLITALSADFLLGASLLSYTMKRAKFIGKLDPRYATVCWHLVLGTGVLFAFIATNLMLILMTLVNGTAH